MGTKLVSPIAFQLLEGFLRVCLGESPVGLDAILRLRNVICWDKRRVEMTLRTEILGLIGRNEIETDSDVGPEPSPLSLQFFHSLLQQLAIQIKTNIDDMPALGCSEDVSRPSNLEIPHRDSESCAEPGVLFDGVNASPSCSDRHHVPRKQKIGISLVLGSPDPSAQLVQVGQTESVCAINDDGVRVRDVQPTFDDCGRDQYIRLPTDKPFHDLFQILFIHLAMTDIDPGTRAKESNFFLNAIN